MFILGTNFRFSGQGRDWVWEHADVTVSEMSPSMLLAAEGGEAPNGYIAIDDIAVLSGRCSATFSKLGYITWHQPLKHELLLSQNSHAHEHLGCFSINLNV